MNPATENSRKDHLHPGGQLGRQRINNDPDPVLREVLEWKVAHAAVFRFARLVLAADSAMVPEFEVRPPATAGVGGADCQPVSIDVG